MSFIQKAVVKGTLLGVVQIRNIFYAQVAPSSLDTYQILWTDYLTAVYTPILEWLSGAWVLQSFEVYQKDTEWFLKSEEPLELTGTDNTSQLLPNLISAVLIGKVSEYRGFGRKFMAGLTELATQSNLLETTALVDFAQSAAAYVAVYFGDNSGVLGPGIYDKSGNFRAFTTGLVSSLLGTMRRRKPGLGI